MHLILILLIALTPKPTAMQQAQAYAVATHHKLTVTPIHGWYFVEMNGSDIFGTGKTPEEAAEDFMHCADLLTHEPADPGHAPAQFVCPDKAYCI